jgi:hypothetical protein
MIAEWNILVKIWETLRTELRISMITMQHIKGHSDDNQEYNQLSLLQQLNVDADKLADQYVQDHMNKEYRWVRILPSNEVQLHLATGTITHQMKRQVKEAKVIENQIKYICKK